MEIPLEGRNANLFVFVYLYLGGDQMSAVNHSNTSQWRSSMQKRVDSFSSNCVLDVA